MTKKYTSGFTVIEIIFVAVLAGVVSVIFFAQKNNLESIANDNLKKTSINAMYYSLEEVFYTSNSYYPQTISSDVLKSVDPDLFTDPSGIKFGDEGSSYAYTPTNCLDNKCKSYTLKAILENETDYIKTSKNS